MLHHPRDKKWNPKKNQRIAALLVCVVLLYFFIKWKISPGTDSTLFTTKFSEFQKSHPVCEPKEGEVAWIISAFDQVYLNNAYVIYETIRKRSNIQKIYFLTRKENIVPHWMKNVLHYDTVCQPNERFYGSDTKINLLANNLTEKVFIHVDSDILLLTNIDEIFCCPEPGIICGLALKADEYFNTGFFAFQKNTSWDLEKIIFPECRDQKMFTPIIEKNRIQIRDVDYNYNYRISTYADKDPLPNIKVLHFNVRSKPWNSTSKIVYPDNPFFKKWWDIERTLSPELKPKYYA